MYACPVCKKPLPAALVEEPAGDDYPMAFHDVTFICFACGRTIEAKAVHTADGEALVLSVPVGEESGEVDPDQARIVAFFRQPPQSVAVAGKAVCQVCGCVSSSCLCAADLMRAGWRVVQEWPGLRATCPNCYGGQPHA